MKNFTLINNEWKEIIDPNITEEEKLILNNPESTLEEVKIISDAILQRKYISPTEEDSLLVQWIYDQNKIEKSELISVDISLPNGNGIINCFINGEHKQIRF